MDRITMLGTGHAMTFSCFNTCFVYENENGRLLVDTGGGNGLVAQMQKVGMNPGEMDALFISHRHTDHITGLAWVLRSLGGPGREKPLTMYLHEDVYRVAVGFIDLLFPDDKENLMKNIRLVKIQDGDTGEILGRPVQFFDLNSPNVPQFGFVMTLPTGKRFVFHGDVPFHECNRQRLQGAEILMHEAFHLSGQQPGPMPGGPGKPGTPPGPMPGGPGMPPPGGKPGKPGRMGHSTVKEAAGYGESLGAETLILVHGSDNDLSNRKEKYMEEAFEVFAGKIYAPNDLDVIELE